MFYSVGFNLLPRYEKNEISSESKISIIIAARNEEVKISACLTDILNQTYPRELFEIIVIDDFSTDKTAKKIASLNSQQINFLSLKDFVNENENIKSFKKKAIEIAVEKASGRLIITTDADCRMGKNWLNTIVSFYEKTKCKMIAAPVTFSREKTIFENLQSLDFIGFQGITGACLFFNFPNMCNGANLIFEKKAFEEVGGYTNADNTASGDDMMLMHKIAKQFPRSVKFLKSRNATVFTYAQPTVKSFWSQRIRWTSKTGFYKDWRIPAILYSVFIFYLLIFWNGIFSILKPEFLPCFLLPVLAKMCSDYFFLFSVTAFFRRQKLMLLFFPAWIFHIVYVLIVGVAVNFVKPDWKGRKIS